MPKARPWILHPSLGPLTDIPVERPTVGGMGSPTMGSQYPENETRFRPYVYRGTGRDIYEEPPPPRRKPKHDPAKVRAANIKRVKRTAKPKPPRKTPEELAAIRAEAGRKRSERAAKRRAEQEQWRREQAARHEAEARRWARINKKPYASPDWKPPTGEDIEALLNELED